MHMYVFLHISAGTHPPTEHRLRERTFSTMQWCDKCGRFMFGLVQQGLECAGKPKAQTSFGKGQLKK